MEYTMSAVAPSPDTETVVVRYAGFWRRVVAWAIDFISLTGFNVLLMILFGVRITESEIVGASSQPAIDWIMGFTYWLYYTLMPCSKYQGTLGKMALGIRITDLDGNRIGYLRSCGRLLAEFVSAIVMGIGFIMAGLTSKKQALHDMMAKTLVVVRQSGVPASVAHNVMAAS